jgi:hypothetical protein
LDDKDYIMKMTESRLRRIVRNVLAEKLGFNKTYKRKKHGDPSQYQGKDYGGGGHSGGYYDDDYADGYDEGDEVEENIIDEDEEEAEEN